MPTYQPTITLSPPDTNCYGTFVRELGQDPINAAVETYGSCLEAYYKGGSQNNLVPNQTTCYTTLQSTLSKKGKEHEHERNEEKMGIGSPRSHHPPGRPNEASNRANTLDCFKRRGHVRWA